MNLWHTASSTLIFYVNGVKVVLDNPQPEWTLLFYLRDKLRFTGTKLGCGEGGCGACTVMVSRFDRSASKIRHYAINSCLTPVCSLHGLAVTTIEGIGQTQGFGLAQQKRLHSIQARITQSHGSQCGYCTPGFVMSMYTLLRSTEIPSMDQVTEAFQGNLCRCTGYRPILEGCRTFTREAAGCCRANPDSIGCCQQGNLRLSGSANGDPDSELSSLNPTVWAPYDPSQEPIFPPELQVNANYDQSLLLFQSEKTSWYRPVTLEQLLELKKEHPGAKIVCGNTEIALEQKFQHKIYPTLVNPALVPELSELRISDNKLVIGAGVVLDQLESFLRHQISILPECETRVFAAVVGILQFFGGKQIRNVATIAGNIITASPISDLVPILVACGAVLELVSTEGTRCLTMSPEFFTGYRATAIKPNEILLRISIPKTSENDHFKAFKQSKRQTDDITIVNAAFWLSFQPGSRKITDFRIAFGGMGPTVKVASCATKHLIGREWGNDILEEGTTALVREVDLAPDAPGGMIRFRQSLCLSFFLKFFNYVSDSINGATDQEQEVLPLESAQYFQEVPEDQSDIDPLGRPIPHTSGSKHTTGEAAYCDDLPKVEGELFMALVTSKRTHAKITRIDPDPALQVKGVHAFLSAKDVPQGKNLVGAVIKDDEIFASDKVTRFGQVIGCIVADDREAALHAARLVDVQYEDVHPLLLTIDDAIQHQSFYQDFKNFTLEQGDLEAGFEGSDVIHEGVFSVGGQEHFYLETNAVLVNPSKEDGEMEITASCQMLSVLQMEAAKLLDIPANRIVVKAKRLGGGFGAKILRPLVITLPAVLAAAKLQRPVRCVVDRDEDMMLSGGRHSLKAKYKVGFMKDGKIMALDIQIFLNGGNTLDVSGSVLKRSLYHITNGYTIPNVLARGSVCKTNLPSNTAFRGFGAPQTMLTCENIITNIATILGKDPEIICTLNLCKIGDLTPYGQVMEDSGLERCWRECLTKSEYERRRKEVQRFNSSSRYVKKGIAIVPVQYGLGFSIDAWNQGGALVNIYLDGSVILSHGGIEMGQGLHTKMIQIASRVLGVPESKIHTLANGTDTVPNASPTAASISSDLNGMAVLDACQTLMRRLKPVQDSLKGAKWEDVIKEAYSRKISLSATGFYAHPGKIAFDFATGQGKPIDYFTFGVACSEVQIDCLTGNHQVLRTDIVMDIGQSLNPAIDVGQIEGAFVQGLGMFTTEEPLFSADGVPRTRGPSTYKIPTAEDIPRQFNVTILKGSSNPRAVYSSKAVGEPPLFLSGSVFFAIKAAIQTARKDHGLEGPFPVDSPLTVERIRMACEDPITQKVPGTAKNSWTIAV